VALQNRDGEDLVLNSGSSRFRSPRRRSTLSPPFFFPPLLLFSSGGQGQNPQGGGGQGDEDGGSIYRAALGFPGRGMDGGGRFQAAWRASAMPAR
jgi:hypothetical protein